jgi:MFS family permease
LTENTNHKNNRDDGSHSSLPLLTSHPSPSLYVILAEGFLSRLSFGIISFVLPLYAYRKMGLSLTATGFLFSINLIVEQAFKPLMGWVADHAGLKRTFTVAIALRSLIALLFAYASAPWHIFAIKALHGFSESLRDPSVGALIAEHADKKKMAAAFGWYTTAKMSAGSLGKAAGGWLLWLTLENYTQAFWVAFALSFLPLFVVMRYLEEPAHHEPLYGEKTENAADKTKESFLPVLILGSLITSTAMMMNNLFPVLATEYAKLTPGQAGWVYTIAPLVTIIGGPLFGWLADNVSHKLVLLVRGFSNICSSLLFIASPTFGGLLVGNAVDSLGKAAFRPAWGALMARAASVDRSRRARVTSYFGLGEGIGETVGPLLGGFIWQHWGIVAMLGVRVAMALVAEIYALIVARSTRT